eukprot:3145112-Pyramimonas_sp.AAC.1
MTSGTRVMPLNADDLLALVLQELGGTVFCAVGLDGDDVVAKLAHEAGPDSLLLSADNDMLRYDLPRLEARLMVDFNLGLTASKKPLLHLVAQTNLSLRPKTSRRKLEDIPHDPERWKGHKNKLLYVAQAPRGYQRGCTSPIDKQFGNLHVLVRPLRQVVYQHLGHQDTVKETIPQWCEDKDNVTWDTLEVGPDASLSHVLNAEAAVEAFEWVEARDPCIGAGKDIPSRAFARCVIVAEMLDAIDGAGLLTTAETLGGPDTLRQQTEGAASFQKPRDLFGSKNNFSGNNNNNSKMNQTKARAEKQGKQGSSRGETEHICKGECGNTFLLSAGERAWFAQKGFALPQRCKLCRQKRHAHAQ